MDTTIAGLNPATATKQEVFDFVAKQLIQQGKPAYENGRCRYRTEDGSKCAAGHLFPDSEYRTAVEGLGVWVDHGLPLTLLTLRASLGHAFLRDIQRAHDAAGIEVKTGYAQESWLVFWAAEMRGVAKSHGLNAAVLDGVA